MVYSLRCRCGAGCEVRASQAGSEVDCRCGATLVVPWLSELRVLAGHGAFETSAIDVIRRQLAEGTLELSPLCVLSGLPTADLVHARVQCEQVWTKKASGLSSHLLAVAGMLIWPLGLFRRLFARDLDEPCVHLGRNRSISAPLRVHRDRRDEFCAIRSQRRLRELLATVPVYARLLEEYPEAEITAVG